MAYLLNLVFCKVLLVILASAEGSPVHNVTYDQRQTGDYNIHISLKDIKIIALLNGGLGEPEDYDYNYDYSEMTIKPSQVNGTTSTTTKKPIENSDTNSSTTTEKVVNITPSPPSISTSKTPILAPSDVKSNISTVNDINLLNKTETPVLNKPFASKPNQSAEIPVKIVLTPVHILSDFKERNGTSTPRSLLTTSTPQNNTTVSHQADCIDGFRKDRQGNCRPKVKKPQQQTLLRKLIQLSQRMHNPVPTPLG